MVDSGTNGVRHWKRTIDAKYILEIAVQCRGSSDTVDLLSRLEGQPKSTYENLPSHQGVIRATWVRLPECPQVGQLLTLQRLDETHEYSTLAYQLDLSVGWSRRRNAEKSLLRQYSKLRNQTLLLENQKLPRPRTDVMDKATQHVIMFKYDDGVVSKARIVEGLYCPLCGEREKTFARLLLHCSTFHDHFRFDDIEEDSRAGLVDPTIIRKTILMSVSEKQYEKVTPHGPDEQINWVAPDRPFDLRAHVLGDESWTGNGKRPGRRRKKAAVPQERDPPPATAPRSVWKRPAPEDVAELPRIIHRRHQVPDVPNVRFYHTISKVPASPGSQISDSDESVDQTWLEQKQRRQMDELLVVGAAQDMIIALERCMAREVSQSPVLAREAIVRCTRNFLRDLQDMQFQRAYRKKLELFRSAGVIDRATVMHCIKLIQGFEATNGGLSNGVDGGDKVYQSNAQPNGVEDGMNGLDKASLPGDVNGVTGFSKEKPRVRWGEGGSIDRQDERMSPNPARPKAHVNGHPRNGLANGLTNGYTNGSMPNVGKDLDDRLSNMPVNGATKANGLTNGHTSEEASARANGVPKTAPEPEPNGLVQQLNSPTAHLCTCGKSALGAKGAIPCAGSRCLRRNFHLKCVGLQRRQVGWKCRDCGTREQKIQ